MLGVIDISFVIVSWNVEDIIQDCLTSIEQSPINIDGLTKPDTYELTAEAIVVDSASSDGTVSMLQEKFPWVKLSAHEENIGFVKGTNLGTAKAQGKTIFWLNPDTELLEDAVVRLYEVLHQDEKIGAVGPHTLNTDGSYQSSKRRFPTLMTGIFESTWLESVAPQRLIKEFRAEDILEDSVAPVDWVQGSAILMKRDVYEEIGAFDERFIMYSEELDWCRRMFDAGWQLYYVGDAKIIHHSGQSTSQVKVRSQIHFQHSKIRYFQKFHGHGAALMIRLVLIFNYIWQVLLEGLKWLIGHKRDLRAERVAAYWTVLKSLTYAGEDIILNTTN